MDVKVAVVDNGCGYPHPDLAIDFKTGELRCDFIGNYGAPRPHDTTIQEPFHGTHVAGIIAATRDNRVGIAGWSVVQLLAVRGLNDSDSGTTDCIFYQRVPTEMLRFDAFPGERLPLLDVSVSIMKTQKSMRGLK